jgi:hypothetical protein
MFEPVRVTRMLEGRASWAAATTCVIRGLSGICAIAIFSAQSFASAFATASASASPTASGRQ